MCVVVIGLVGVVALVGIAAGTADGEHADIAEAMGLHSDSISHKRWEEMGSYLPPVQLPSLSRAWGGLNQRLCSTLGRSALCRE
jgi:hypothetical protein